MKLTDKVEIKGYHLNNYSKGEIHLRMSLSGRGSPAWGSPMDYRRYQEAGVLARGPVSGKIQWMRPKRYREGHIHPGYLYLNFTCP